MKIPALFSTLFAKLFLTKLSRDPFFIFSFFLIPLLFSYRTQAMQQENPESSNTPRAKTLTYDPKAQQICVFYEQNTVCYSATYQLDSCDFCAQTQCLQTPGSNWYNARATKRSKKQLRMLVNRVRTFLILNNFDNTAPALAHMQRLFYTKTQ
jgi:hypothetical protein